MNITSNSTISVGYLDSTGYSPTEISIYFIKGGVKQKAVYNGSAQLPEESSTMHTYTSPVLTDGVHKIEVIRSFTEITGRTDILSVSSVKKISFTSTFNLLTSSFGYIGSDFVSVTLPLTPDMFEEGEVPSLTAFSTSMNYKGSGNISIVEVLDSSSSLDKDGNGNLVVTFYTQLHNTVYRFSILKKYDGKISKVAHGVGLRPALVDSIVV